MLFLSPYIFSWIAFSTICDAHPASTSAKKPAGPHTLFEQNISPEVANEQKGREIIDKWIEQRGKKMDYKYKVTLEACQGKEKTGKGPFKYDGYYDARKSLEENTGILITMTTGLEQKLEMGVRGCKNILESTKFDDYCKLSVEIDPVDAYNVGLPHISLAFGTCEERGDRNNAGAKALIHNHPLWTAGGLLNYEKRVNSTSAKGYIEPVRFGEGEFDLEKLRKAGVLSSKGVIKSIMAENALADAALWAKVADTYEPPDNFALAVNKNEKRVHWYEAQPAGNALNNPKSFGEMALATKEETILRPDNLI